MKNLDIIVTDEVKSDLPLDIERLRNYVITLLDTIWQKSYNLNIVFINDDMMRELNVKYKKGTGATDVLTFSLSDEEAEVCEGEIYIAPEYARARAVEYGVMLENELIRLVTHGLLHFTGRIHDTEEAYKDMMDATDNLMKLYISEDGN